MFKGNTRHHFLITTRKIASGYMQNFLICPISVTADKVQSEHRETTKAIQDK